MRRYAIAFAIGIILAGCAGSTAPVASPVVQKLTDAKTINAAEESFYVAVKAYEAAMTTINRSHAKGSIDEARYAEIISTAQAFRTASLGVFNAIQFWRQTANRLAFDDQAAKAQTALNDILTAAGGAH